MNWKKGLGVLIILTICAFICTIVYFMAWQVPGDVAHTKILGSIFMAGVIEVVIGFIADILFD